MGGLAGQHARACTMGRLEQARGLCRPALACASRQLPLTLRPALLDGHRAPPSPAARRAPAQTAVLVKRLRQALDALLGRKVRQPGLRLEEAGGPLMQSIVDLLNHEEAAQRWDR